MKTVAQVLRGLRPFLPPGYKKVVGRQYVGYSYGEDKLLVQVQGVCEWNATEKVQNACRAYRVTVSPNSESRLRTRSYNSKKDGTFNFEAIGANIQRMLSMLKEVEKAAEKARKDRREWELRCRKLHHMALSIAKKAGQDAALVYQGGPVAIGESGRIQSNGETFDVRLNGLTVVQLTKLIREVL